MPSSVIRRYQYTPDDRTLRVVFVSGAVYDYFDVPNEIADAFAAVRSKGEFFGKVIRPFFRFEKVQDAREDRWTPSLER
jgi:hypothetical protein